jgi:hypothetical protein
VVGPSGDVALDNCQNCTEVGKSALDNPEFEIGTKTGRVCRAERAGARTLPGARGEPKCRGAKKDKQVCPR